MRLASGIVAALAVLCASRTALAADINADPTTYKALLGTLKPGDTLHLAAGHYPRIAVTNLNGLSGAWITITGPAVYPRTAIVDADSGPCCNTVEITSSSYVALENLTIDGHDVDGAFGISAKGANNLVHDIRVESCSLINHHGSQQHDAISTKVPTWGWILRKNEILRAGTGLYLGNSDGSAPFIGGIIEQNLVDGPIGYCMEIKFQTPRPSVAGMPTSPTTTIIRNNVFIKNDDPSPDGDRPNVLVGGFPATGAGSSDRYEIYGNVFLHNPRESLLQASGRVTIHDNLFVDASSTHALLLQNHDLPLSQAYVYDNTVYGGPAGITFGSSAPQGDAVVGNLVFATSPISGPIANLKDNLTDTPANAAKYVNAPSNVRATMDFYPLAGKCKGTPIDASLFTNHTAHAVDFNGTARGFEFRGAYAGEGKNPGSDGGVPPGTDGGGGDASAGGDSGAPPGATPGSDGGCSCRAGVRGGDARGPAWFAVVPLLMILRRRRTAETRR